MTVKVSVISGPDTGAFLYLLGTDESCPAASQTRTVALAALASGAVTIASEKAALVAAVEQAVTNWHAAQAAMQEI